MSAAKVAAAEGAAFALFLLFLEACGARTGVGSSSLDPPAPIAAKVNASSSSLSSCLPLPPPLPPFFLSFFAFLCCALEAGPPLSSSSSASPPFAAACAEGFAAGHASSSELSSPLRLPFLFFLGLPPPSPPPPPEATGSFTVSSSLKSCNALPFLPPFFPMLERIKGHDATSSRTG